MSEPNYDNWGGDEHDYGGDDALEEFENEDDVYYPKWRDAEEEIERQDRVIAELHAKLQEKFEASQTPILVAQVEALDKVMAALESYHDAAFESAKYEGVIEYLESQKLKCKPFKVILRNNSVGIYRDANTEFGTHSRWYELPSHASIRRLMRICEKAKPIWNEAHMNIVFEHEWTFNYGDVT